MLLPLWIDRLRGFLICAALIFSPWAFGTTQLWSIWTMNVLSYALGFLTLAHWILRRPGFSSPDSNLNPNRNLNPSPPPPAASSQPETLNPKPETSAPSHPQSASPPSSFVLRHSSFLPRLLLALTLLILGYILLSWINAAADYTHAGFILREGCARWLPATFDRVRTLEHLFNDVALACCFWATVDWLRQDARDIAPGQSTSFALLPRFRLLLWLLCINGAILAVEGLVQRTEGSGKLLFLVQPRVNREAVSQFGPYAYRSNAAQYLNLIWPLAAGFWISLRRVAGIAAGRRPWAHHVLAPLLLIMAVASLSATSRAGAIVCAFDAVLVLAIALLAFRGQGWRTYFGIGLILATVIAFGGTVAWRALQPRLQSFRQDFNLREDIYATGWKAAHDYPVFGTGAGSLDAVFQIYRSSPDEYWPAQLHNDWLETLITFGVVGAVLIWGALAVVLSRWFFRGRIRANKWFMAAAWTALAGCLIHARWDFPFQMYSIVHLFLTVCAILFCVSRERAV